MAPPSPTRFAPLASFLLLGLLSCGGPPPAPAPAPEETEAAAPPAEAVEPAPAEPAADEASPSGPMIHPEAGADWAERTLASLTLEEKVGQMMMPFVIGDFAPKGSPGHERAAGFVEEGIGGIIMSVGMPTEVAAKINDLQGHAKLPLLVAADLETGAGFRFRGAVQGTIPLGGATNFPSLMAVGATGDPDLAYAMGRITAVEARALGVHIPFAPVLDVNNNPDNPIINTRSFGEDPDLVARMGAAFVRGVQDNGAIATGKHFPGHGDTGTDSHLSLPTITHDRARMDSVELKPFQAAIDAGMGAIMTAHITTPSLNGGTADPATLSPAVLTRLLREDMRFGGLIFTDAMDMGAISGRLGAGEAAVQAVEAGADVILMPPAVRPARDGIVEAVRSGRLTEARIDRSVLALLRTKQRLGLHEERLVPIENVMRDVGLPAHEAVADEIARRSITLLRNGGDLLPLRGTSSANVLSVSFRRSYDVLAGRYFNSELRETYRRLRTVELTRDSGSDEWEGVLRQARNSALVVVGVYVTAVSYAGTVAVPEEVADFVAELGRRDIPHVVISFGNPYMLSDFPNVRSYMLAWSNSEASQRAAAGALFADFAIAGRAPTGAPPLFAIGDGISLAARGTAETAR